MNNKKTNSLSIIAFIASIFTVIIGTILCLVALAQIKERGEKGKGFAIGGIVINILKIVAVTILIVLYIIAPSADDFEYKCKHADSCEYNLTEQNYTCTFDNSGVEEYITCDPKYIDDKTSPTSNDGTTDDPEYDDTFDYDAEY